MFKALLMDMDGVLYHGNQALPHAIDFIHQFRHYPLCFITNNPILPPHLIRDKLHNMGFHSLDNAQILTSAMATSVWLSQQKTDYRFFAVGAPGLINTLRETGQEDHQHADYVIIGEGAGLTYQTLTQGLNLILQQQSTLICTNPDISVDSVLNGQPHVLPGGGALVSPFETASGQKAIYVGKPQPLLYQMALEKIQCDAKDCLMIGDRPDTDILGAARLGIQTALVRSGRFSVNQPYPASLPLPDYDVHNLQQLQQQLSRVTIDRR
jgi:HAD superfamily hydrolase (TIGR01450 family)